MARYLPDLSPLMTTTPTLTAFSLRTSAAQTRDSVQHNRMEDKLHPTQSNHHFSTEINSGPAEAFWSQDVQREVLIIHQNFCDLVQVIINILPLLQVQFCFLPIKTLLLFIFNNPEDF